MTKWEHIKAAGSHIRNAIPFAARSEEGRPVSDPGNALGMASLMQPGGRVPVTEQNALTLSAVWAAVRVISGSIGILPLHVYACGADGGRTEVPGDAATEPAALLTSQPNSEMTGITFWETLVGHALTAGNGYAEIERDQMGRPIGLWPLGNTTRPKRDSAGVLYYEARCEGKTEQLAAEDVFHLPGFGFDGLRGYSPVTLARRSLGLAATAEQAGEGFLADGMRPGGVLEYPGTLAQLTKDNLDESLSKKHGGAAKFGKAMVLYGGMKWNSIAISPDDAQFLETRQFQIVEIARWFCVPPHLLRDLSRATFSNIEQQGQDFVTYTLLYWLTKITQEYGRKILAGRPNLYAEHTLATLLRGDTISRYTAYGIGVNWGLLSPNECRARENLSPRAGGDEYLQPVNMSISGTNPTGPTGKTSGSSIDAAAVELAVAKETEDVLAVANDQDFGGYFDQFIGGVAESSFRVRLPWVPLTAGAKHFDRFAEMLTAIEETEPLFRIDAANRWRAEEPRRILDSLGG